MFVINHSDLSSAITRLKYNKACGPDDIAAEAINYGGKLLSLHLTLLFNRCIRHIAIVPLNMMQTTVVPGLRNKSGDISDATNYRAIVLSNYMNKLLRVCLAPQLSVSRYSEG